MFRNHTEFVKRHNTDQLLYISNRGVNIIQFRCIQSSECWTCTLYRVVYLWEGKEKSHTQWRILCYFFISAEFLRRILFIYCNIFPNPTSELWKPDIYIYIVWDEKPCVLSVINITLKSNSNTFQSDLRKHRHRFNNKWNFCFFSEK